MERRAICRTACLIALVVSSLLGCQHLPQLPVAAGADNQASEPGLAVRWFGTSTVTVSDGATTVMIDAFVTRPGKVRSILAVLGAPVIAPRPGILEHLPDPAAFDDVDALFVSHAHHDHALDAAWIARRVGARVHGSQSVGRIVEGSNAGVAFTEIGAGDATCEGRFRVRTIASPHKSSWVAPAGDIQKFRTPARMRRFRAGSSFAFLLEHPQARILVIPSAVLPPSLPPHYPPAEVVLLGVGMLGHEASNTTQDYWRAAVHPGVTRQVHPIHWDDFTRSLAKPATPFPLDRVAHSLTTLDELDPHDVEFSYLPVSAPTRLPVYSPPEGPDGWCRATGTALVPG